MLAGSRTVGEDLRSQLGPKEGSDLKPGGYLQYVSEDVGVQNPLRRS